MSTQSTMYPMYKFVIKMIFIGSYTCSGCEKHWLADSTPKEETPIYVCHVSEQWLQEASLYNTRSGQHRHCSAREYIVRLIRPKYKMSLVYHDRIWPVVLASIPAVVMVYLDCAFTHLHQLIRLIAASNLAIQTHNSSRNTCQLCVASNCKQPCFHTRQLKEYMPTVCSTVIMFHTWNNMVLLATLH